MRFDGNSGLSNYNVAAIGTFNTVGKTCFGAGRRIACNYYLCVTFSINVVIHVAVVTARTGVGCISRFFASRSGYGCYIVMRM